MSNSALESRVATLARQYSEKHTTAELKQLLVETWAQAEGATVPVRSNDSPAMTILKRLLKNLQRYSEVSTATLVVIAEDVLHFLDASGYKVDRFEIPVAIMVAIIVKAILGEYRDDDTPSPPASGAAAP